MADNYIPVRISALPLGENCRFAIFLTMRGKYYSARDAGQALDQGVIDELQRKGKGWAYISAVDYVDYLRTYYDSGGRGVEGNRLRYFYEQYIPINARILQAASRPNFTVFTMEEGYLPAPLVAPQIAGVAEEVQPEHREMGQLFIAKDELPFCARYVRDQAEAPLVGEKLGYMAGLLVRAEADLVAIILYRDKKPSPSSMTDTLALVARLLSLIKANPRTYYSLLKVSGLSARIFTHGVNVSVMAMGLGLALRCTEEQLVWLGLGGILHDIGMLWIDPGLLYYSGRLSDSERQEMQQHVVHGQGYCARLSQVPEAVARIVQQHHERLDGSGYVRGLQGDHLDPLGQIVTLMEIYDSMTTTQPYRGAVKPFKALSKIIQMGDVVNQTIFKEFIRHLGTQESVDPSP